MKPGDKAKIEALHLCGFSIEDVSAILFPGKGVGAVGKYVTARKLTALRSDDRARVARLVELDACGNLPKGFLAHHAAKSAAVAKTINPGKRWNTTMELAFRRDLPQTLAHVAGIIPERAYVPEKRARSDEQVNTANCPLEWYNAHRKLPEWAYQAGVRLRRDAGIAGGSLRGVNFMAEAVDGGRPPGSIPDSALDAMDRITDARAAVLHYWGAEGRNYLAVIDKAVVSVPAMGAFVKQGEAMHAMGAGMLIDALGPVAWCYNLAPVGEITRRMAGWVRPSEARRRRNAMAERDLMQTQEKVGGSI